MPKRVGCRTCSERDSESHMLKENYGVDDDA
jgi:hypothetical protein